MNFAALPLVRPARQTALLCRLPKIWRAVPIFLARVNGVLVWLFDKGEMDDKIAMIAMRRRIFRKNVPTSNAQQSCIASLNLCSRFVAHIPIRVFEECTLQ